MQVADNQASGLNELPSPYSQQLLVSIKRAITHERLKRYLRATGQDDSKALALYEYNVQLSEALYGLLHGLEVTVRNAEHYALTASYGTSTWYDLAPLTDHWQRKLEEAKSKSKNPGKVIAELTFGFWIDLLKKTNHWILWMNPNPRTGLGRSLHTAFPNATCQKLHS